MAAHAPALPLVAAFSRELYHCSDCNYCADAVWAERGIDHVCSTLAQHDSRPAYSGRGYVAAARAWLEGRAIEEHVLAERVFSCASCGNCEAVCPIGLHPRAINLALRGELLARGHAPAPIAALRAHLLTEDNPNGRPRAERQAWAAGLELSATPEVLYYPGCAVAYSRPAEARAAVRLMHAAGVRVGTLGPEEPCCGAPLRELGDGAGATRAAQRLGTAIAQGAQATFVYSGLDCRRQWSGETAFEGALSFGEWCLRAIESGRLRLAARGTFAAVAVFDSCQARGTPAAAAPRALLAQLGVPILNPDPAAYGLCCRAGGGASTMAPGTAALMAESKLAEARAVSCLIGVDARCLSHLEAQRRPADPEVMTLAEFLSAHFELGVAG